MAAGSARSLLALGALVALACGDGETSGAAEPDGTSGAEAVALAPAGAPTVRARPARTSDVALRVLGPRHVGPIDAEATRAYPLGIEIRNLSSAPISIAPALIHVSVFHRSLLVEGCSDPAPRPIGADAPLAAGVSARVAISLPCALPEPGRYEILVVLMTEAPASMGAALAVDARASASMRLRVDAGLPPLSARRPITGR